MSEPTTRSRLKAARRSTLLRAAAELFAERGFHSVSMEDLGAAAGISGPAVYRHFASKEAVLSELLVGVSQKLLDGGRQEAAAEEPPGQTLGRLIAFHADFAVDNPDLIRVQDRDLTSLPDDDAVAVRRLQRSYVEIWVETLCRHDRSLRTPVARTKVHATFGLLNSTPHSAVRGQRETTRVVLIAMACAALLAPGDARGFSPLAPGPEAPPGP